MTTFIVIEQHDGRYIVVALYGKQSITSRKGETLIGYEDDCRSFNEAYSAIAEYVVDSGMYCDGPTTIEHVRFYKPEKVNRHLGGWEAPTFSPPESTQRSNMSITKEEATAAWIDNIYAEILDTGDLAATVDRAVQLLVKELATRWDGYVEDTTRAGISSWSLCLPPSGEQIDVTVQYVD